MQDSVLVCQRGARHRYAIPRLLEEAGSLAALYTDSCAYGTAGKVAATLIKCGIKPAAVKALASRIPKGVPKNKVFSSDRHIFGTRFGNNYGKSISEDYMRWGLQGASMVYSMYGEDPDFLEWAKGQGAQLIVDVFVHPESNRIIAEESNRVFNVARPAEVDDENKHSRRVFELADILLCPSEWVAEGVRSLMPECAGKIRIVPYGSSVGLSRTINQPKVGTLLFAGRDPLRKGLHHLAEAVYLLRKAGLKIDARVAGVAAQDIEWMPHRNELTCLGSVPMDQMKEEYAAADVFVLPSLSEGQAGVLLEAMASGVPVVATRESGVDFSCDGGITVPAGHADELAQAIRAVVEDRGLRNRLAEGALHQAALFSMDEWKRRLLSVIDELSGRPCE